MSQESLLYDSRPAIPATTGHDEAAFADVYAQYSRSVYNLVLRSTRDAQLAEDICQEVWIKVCREMGGLREPKTFATWLYRIAARACVDAARKRSHSPVTTELG